MMRLNRNPRQNLTVGQRVQTDLRSRPEDVYQVTELYDLRGASDGYAIKVRRVYGVCESCGAAKVTEAPPISEDRYPIAACWFWPEGILEVVPDGAGFKGQ